MWFFGRRRKKTINGFKTKKFKSNYIGVYNTRMSKKNKYGKAGHDYSDHFRSIRYLRYE